MAAEIRPGVKFATNKKPALVGKVEGFTEVESNHLKLSYIIHY